MGMDDFIGLWELAIRLDDDTRFKTEFEYSADLLPGFFALFAGHCQ